MSFYYYETLQQENTVPLAKQPSSVNWYVRRAVPRDLVEAVGKRELWRTLKTSDKSTALRRSRKVEAEFDAVFDRAKAQQKSVSVDQVPEDRLTSS